MEEEQRQLEILQQQLLQEQALLMVTHTFLSLPSVSLLWSCQSSASFDASHVTGPLNNALMIKRLLVSEWGI